MTVLIAIPSKTAQIHAQLVQNLVPQIQDNPFLILAGVSPVAKARNTIVEQFLKTDATHLWMIDDDTIPPKDALEKLLALEKPIASGVTPILRHEGLTSNVYMESQPLSMDDATKDKKPFPAIAVGASCLMIERETLRKMHSKYRGRIFEDQWTPSNELISEDIVFCNRARESYLQINIHPEVVCRHARNVII